MRTGQRTQWLVICGMLAPIQVVFFILAAAVATPGYSHFSDTISALGAHGQPYAWFIGLGLVIYGILVCACGRGLHTILGPSRSSAVLWIALSVHGLSVLFAGVLQDYAADHAGPITFAADLHGYLAYVAFASLIAAMFASAFATRGSGGWNNHSALSVAAAAAAIALVMLFFIDALHPVQGLVQRTFYLFPMMWLAFTSLQAYGLSMATERSDAYNSDPMMPQEAGQKSLGPLNR